MQSIGSIVLGKLEGPAIECELSIGDAIRIPTDCGAEEGFIIYISVKILVTKDDIRHIAGAIRSLQRNQRGAEGDNVSLDPVLVLQHVKVDRGAFRCLAE